jgi:hypothetical protein
MRTAASFDTQGEGCALGADKGREQRYRGTSV